MERRAGDTGFWVVTAILILVTACCCGGTVMGRSGFSTGEPESYYLECERQLVEEAREYLGRQGYENSGVMLTRVVDVDGGREYTLNIHHNRIGRLDEEEKQWLAEGLWEIVFTDPDCTFSIHL